MCYDGYYPLLVIFFCVQKITIKTNKLLVFTTCRHSYIKVKSLGRGLNGELSDFFLKHFWESQYICSKFGGQVKNN